MAAALSQMCFALYSILMYSDRCLNDDMVTGLDGGQGVSFADWGRFSVVTAVNSNVLVCSLVERYECFEGLLGFAAGDGDRFL